ncbi:hypothetical protein ACWU4D_04445 [Vibrio sp. WJH972]
MTNKSRAAVLYTQLNPSSNNALKIIELILQDFTLDDIIRNSRKYNINLGSAGISSAYYKYKRAAQELVIHDQ